MQTIEHRGGDPTNNALSNLQVREQPMVVAENPSVALVEGVMRAAGDPNVDAGKMERLWAIAKEAQADQAKREYMQAMKAAQSEMPRIVKDAVNKQTSSKYAKLEQIVDKITPVYTRHGFSLSFGTADSSLDRHIRIVCTVMHEGGHEKVEFYDQPIDMTGIRGEANKTETHGRGSALTYGRRYLTTLVFNISIGEDDDGNKAENAGKPITDVETAFIARAEACEHPKEASDLRTEVIKHYGSSTKVPPVVMEAINAARDTTRPRD